MLKEKNGITRAYEEANDNLKALSSFDCNDSPSVLSEVALYLKWKSASMEG